MPQSSKNSRKSKATGTEIVILDAHTANPGDLTWETLAALGSLTIYKRTLPQQLVQRAGNAQILLTNKVVIGEPEMAQLPHLRCICVLATGYNVVDVDAARKREITVCNVHGYAAHSAAQHTFALLLELANRTGAQAADVSKNGWAKAKDWSYTLGPLRELAGKTLGIFGLGRIGQQVARIALAFGMEVIACHKHPKRDAMPGVRFVPFDTLLKQSDVLTLHAPLTDATRGLINLAALSLMKPSALLLNTSRGGLLIEKDLTQALAHHVIAGAALDVLTQEPPAKNHPLVKAKNCIVTPHIAWATYEARERLIAESVENVKAFLKGKPRNVVVESNY